MDATKTGAAKAGIPMLADDMVGVAPPREQEQ